MRGFTTVSSAFLLTGIVVGTLGAALGWHQYRMLADWPTVDAEVVSSRVVNAPGGYHYEIAFLYHVGGKDYAPTFRSDWTSASHAMVARVIADFAPGVHRLVHYDPDAPGRVRPDLDRWTAFLLPLILGVLGLVFAAIGVGAVVMACRRPRAGRPPSEGLASTLAGWTFVVLGVGGMVGAGVSALAKQRAIQTWPVTDAEVVSSAVRAGSISSRGGGTLVTYFPWIQFAYAVNGHAYTAPAGTGWATASRRRIAQMVANEFAPGTHHRIHYRPDDPNIVRVDLGYTARFFATPLLWGALSLAMVVMGGVLARWGSGRWSTKTSPAA